MSSRSKQLFYQLAEGTSLNHLNSKNGYYECTYKWFQRFKNSLLQYLENHSLSQDLYTSGSKRFLFYVLSLYLYTYDYDRHKDTLQNVFEHGFPRFLNNCLKHSLPVNSQGNIYKRTITENDMSFFLRSFTGNMVEKTAKFKTAKSKTTKSKTAKSNDFFLSNDQKKAVMELTEHPANNPYTDFDKLILIFFDKK